MVETLVLQATKRGERGTRASRALRRKGKVPAIIYGHKAEPLPVALDYHDLALEIQHHHRLLEVELEGRKEKFLIKEVQYDHLGEKILHVDLARVDLDERVTVEVEVELRGTPAGAADGGILEQVNTEVELECLVTSIPECIRASVNHLQMGATLTAGDLELPAGVTLASDPELVIATVTAPTVEEEVAAAPTEAEGAEPEIIAREKKEQEGEEAE